MGAGGADNGAAVTLLLGTLVHPPTVCVAVKLPDVTVLGLPVPPSLHVSVPVTPLAVITDEPQLFWTVNVGAGGADVGAAVTLLLGTLVHPPTVCVAVKLPDVTVLGLPVPPSLHVSVPVTPLAVIIDDPQLF